MTALIGSVLLREVPPRLIAAMEAGDLKVYGSVIRSVSKGRIVGHLQETSALHNLGSLLGNANLPFRGLELAGQATTIIQNEQIKSVISAVSRMQLANLALGAVGIGASVASTAILWRKIDAVEKQVSSIAGTLDTILRKVETIRQDQIADDLARLRAVAEQLNEAWLLPDPVRQWNDVARDAHLLGSVFERRIVAIIESGNHDPVVAEPMLAALSLATASRISARLASGATLAAREAAAAGAETMSNLTEHFGLVPAALSRAQKDMVPAGSREWGAALARHEADLRPLVSEQRARATALASSGLTIEEIERQGLDGRAWLEAAREADVPFLFLNAAHPPDPSD